MRYAIGIDIGGTKVEAVLFNEKLKQLNKKRAYFIKKGSESVVSMTRKDVLDLISNLVDEIKRDKKIEGIGISIPDIITDDGKIAGESKIKSLSNFAICPYFKRKYKCKIIVKNDADCLALGEQRFGAGKGHKNVIGVIYGTGIGAGIVLDGKIYSGTTGSAGEFGHNPVNPYGPPERTGLLGTVEAYAGGADLIDNYIKEGGRIKNPNPGKIFRSKEKIAQDVMNESLDYLARGLAQLMNILNPGIIVLGGGQSNMNVYKKLNMLTKRYTFSNLKKSVKIVKNKLGDSAGVYGAAALIFMNF